MPLSRSPHGRTRIIVCPLVRSVGLSAATASSKLVGYLLSVAPAQRLRVQGLGGGIWHGFLAVAGMVGVITAVLAGSAAGLLAGILTDHSLVAALAVGAAVAIAVLVALMRYQEVAWRQVMTTPEFPGEEVISK